jgi:pyruvate/2-oxoglutarate dehydrogenase complex dihydrolipoamide dehydrogenase (E3) component
VPRSAVFVTPRFLANHEIVAALGAETEHTALGTWVKTDASGRTSLPGVWAVGNVADVAAFVVEATAAGARAAAALNGAWMLWAVAAASPDTTNVAGTMPMAKAPPRMLIRYSAPAIRAS